MWYQSKAKAQGRTAAFANGRVNRNPPAGTIAWGRSPLEPDPSLALDLSAEYARERMPVESSRALLDRGRTIYGRYCMLCHGAAGDGMGITTKFGMNPPPTYTDERIRKLKDGEIFQIITAGKNTMGPLGGRIRPADRWAAVAWVRVLQRAGHAPLAVVPAEDPNKNQTHNPKKH